MGDRRIVLGIVAAALHASGAAAEKTEVGGPVTLNAHAGNLSALAIGSQTTATNTQASVVEGARVRGPVRATATTGSTTAVAAGIGSRAKISVATVEGNYRGGPANLRGSVGRAFVASVRPGSSTCLVVGSAGGAQPGGARTNAHVGSAAVFDYGFHHRTKVRVGTRGPVC